MDLLVPQMCAAESITVAGDASGRPQDDESPVRPDSDCFCCSHTVSPTPCDTAVVLVTTVGDKIDPVGNLTLGVSPLIYHPPLQA